MGNRVRFSLRGLDEALRAKAEQLTQAARPAAQAGAQLLYDAARAAAPVSKAAHMFMGTSYRTSGQAYLFQPGSLRSSIYQVFSADSSADGLATYHVSANPKKAPYALWVEAGRAQRHAVIRTKSGRFMTLSGQGEFASPRRIAGIRRSDMKDH